MNYGTVKKYDIANNRGPGVSLFLFRAASHHCKGCFNSETWDFAYGTPFTGETEEEILEALSPHYIRGFSLLGGKPFEPENQQVLVKFLRRVRDAYPGKDIWCYTGYLYDRDLAPGGESVYGCDPGNAFLY